MIGAKFERPQRSALSKLSYIPLIWSGTRELNSAFLASEASDTPRVLYPLVGVVGIEPTLSRSQTERSPTKPHPGIFGCRSERLHLTRWTDTVHRRPLSPAPRRSLRPRQESNPELRFRRPSCSPLHHRGLLSDRWVAGLWCRVAKTAWQTVAHLEFVACCSSSASPQGSRRSSGR